MYTVVSARGGSGKTTIATNLAVLLAGRPSGTTVLADLNLEFPATALALRSRPYLPIADLVDASKGADDAEFDAMLPRHRSGLRLLTGTMEAGESERLSDEGMRILLQRLTSLYDTVVMDCRPSFRDVYLDIWEACDQILVVCPPDVVSVGLTERLVDAMSSVGVEPDRIRIVLNHIFPTHRLSKAEIDRQIGGEKSVIPYGGPHIHRAEDAGSVFVTEHPKEAAARALRSLAEELVRIGHAAEASRIHGEALELAS